MRKILFLVFSVMFVSQHAIAQEKWVKSLHIGMNVATMKGEGVETDGCLFGPAVMCEVQRNLSKSFAVSAAIAFSRQGSKVQDFSNTSVAEGSSQSNISLDCLQYDYLNFPVLTKYFPIKNVGIQAGLEPGILLSARDKGKELLNGEWRKYIGEGSARTGYLSIPVGLSYQYKGVIVQAVYHLGLINVSDYYGGNIDFKHHYATLSVGCYL